MVKIDRCLYGKVCGLCEQRLADAARGHCGAQRDRDACWWVPTIRDYGGREALSMSKTNIRDGAMPRAS
jgi:hypothetical protein